MDNSGDGDGSTEVGAALARVDASFVDDVESALTGRSGVVAAGVPLALLPAILSARDRSRGEPWQIACRPGVVDTLGRALVLGTAVAEAVGNGEIAFRSAAEIDRDADGAGRSGHRTLFATSGRVDAVVGPVGNQTLVTGGEPNVAGAARAVTERFEATTPVAVDMPSRSRLCAAAAERLDDRFAGDIAAVLESLEYGAVGRIGEVNDQTLLLALAARRDHLFNDLRTWIGTRDDTEGCERKEADDIGAKGVGIAPGQELTAERRALVERELIESIKVPMGGGRPKLRLRAVDDALLRTKPSRVLSVLRGRFALPLDEDGTLRRGPNREGRRPVWQRDR